MNETRIVKVRLHNGAIKECTVEPSSSPPWKLTFSGIELGTQEFSGEDLFGALNALRGALENVGAQLLCAGARLDVFPSGMSRSMGGGRKAYITRMGAPALKTDLIDILDYAGPEAVGGVDQQKSFHEKWTSSLRQ